MTLSLIKERIFSFPLFQEKAALMVTRICLFASLFTPLIISSFTTFPTAFPKAIFFRCLIEIGFCFYLILLLNNRDYLPKISFISICLFVLVEIIFLSSLKGIDFYRSFWGTTERMEGVIAHLHYFAFFLMLSGTVRNWKTVLRAIVGISGVVGVCGILQKLGLFTFLATPDLADQGILGRFTFFRITSTLGNPVFYGNYLTMVVFLSFYLLLTEKERIFKLLSGLVLLINSFCLLLTNSRGAWIGAAAGIIFVLSLWLFFYSRFQSRRKIVLFTILFSLSLFLSLLTLFQSGVLGDSLFFSRFESLFESVFDLNNTRFFAWEIGLKLFKLRPLLGFGQDSFSYLFVKNYDAKLLQRIPEETFFDKAHNIVIDQLVSVGVIGLTVYLALIIGAIVILLKKKSFPDIVIAGIFVAHFVQNVFSFDMTSTYILFYFLLAFVSGSSSAKEGKKLFTSGWRFLLSLALVCLLVPTIFFLNVWPVQASHDLVQSEINFSKGNVGSGIRLMEKCLEYPGFSRLENLFHSFAIASRHGQFPLYGTKDKRKDELLSEELKRVSLQLEDYFTDHQFDMKLAESHFLLATAYRSFYVKENNLTYLRSEERILGKIISFNPSLVKSYRLAGEMRFLEGRTEEGMVFFKKAYSLDHDLSMFYKWLGISLEESGKEEEGMDYLRKAMRLGDFYTSDKFELSSIWNIADVYEKTQNYEKMAEFYEEVIRLYPKDLNIEPQIFASLATVYGKLGKKEKAEKVLDQMVILYPELQDMRDDFWEIFKQNESR